MRPLFQWALTRHNRAQDVGATAKIATLQTTEIRPYRRMAVIPPNAHAAHLLRHWIAFKSGHRPCRNPTANPAAHVARPDPRARLRTVPQLVASPARTIFMSLISCDESSLTVTVTPAPHAYGRQSRDVAATMPSDGMSVVWRAKWNPSSPLNPYQQPRYCENLLMSWDITSLISPQVGGACHAGPSKNILTAAEPTRGGPFE